MRFRTALALSLGAHAALAGGMALYLAYGRQAVTVATLDLSSVELSFAEDESDAAPVAPTPPSPAPEPAPPPPNDDAPPPEPPGPDDFASAPPEPDALAVPSAEIPPPEKMDRPEPPEKTSEEKPPQAEAAPTPAAAPKQARVDALPRPRRSIKPEYPRLSRLRGEEGDVVLEIRVNEHGTVDGVEVVASSGYAELDGAARRAALAAQFEPARLGRAPVASSARLTLMFRIK